MIAVETDPRLVARLQRRFAATSTVTVVEGNALLVPLPTRPFQVVANIPFAITTALLDRLLGSPGTALQQASLLVEWGAARRFTAPRHGDPRVLWWEARFDLRLTRRIGADCFSPPPSVDVAVLRARRRKRPLVAPADQRAFRALLLTMLARPGRPLAEDLGTVFTRRQLSRLAHELGLRLEGPVADLTAPQWTAINSAMIALVDPARRPRARLS